MRILIVLHDFLPRHRAGTELYALGLARALRDRGHEIVFLFGEDRPGAARGRVLRRELDGFVCHEIARPHRARTLLETYGDPVVERTIAGLLDAIAPDVVHVQNLAGLSLAVPELIRARDLPLVMTLHDFGLICPRNARMRRLDGERCLVATPSVCASCCLDLATAAAGRMPSRLRRWASGLARRLPPPLVTRLKRIVARGGGRSLPQSARAGAAASLDVEPHDTATALVHAERGVRARLDAARAALAACDLVLSPSRFLADRFAASGVIARDRVLVSPNGHEPLTVLDAARAHRDPSVLRAAFVGTITADKGVHVLVEAMNRLVDDARVSCAIWGDLEVDPAYARSLQASTRNPRTRLRGPLERADLAAALAATDVLIVPSLWWENAPLTIHEAFLARVPVLVSDIGGMAELVPDGGAGLRFPPGDAAALAGSLRALADAPARLAGLAARAPSVKTFAEDAAALECRYGELAAARDAG